MKKHYCRKCKKTLILSPYVDESYDQYRGTVEERGYQWECPTCDYTEEMGEDDYPDEDDMSIDDLMDDDSGDQIFNKN